jgi:DNA invertase Pin-like site-specific DNA recombinase
MITEALTPAYPRESRSPKIRDSHLERLALVYVRQSTAAQVLEHRESTAMQYNLKHRAVAIGWRDERVIVIDSDQGQSGASAEDRVGFQRLLAEVGLNHVGIILGIDMSRLARSNKDWHQLLELCAIFRTLLGDQDGIYDPSDYNDRLLLGLKGTMSEAELHILRNRLLLGKRNKAERGELFAHPPRGYVKSASGQLVLDPDEQVRATIKLCFEKFASLGSGRALLRWLRDNQIRLPVRVSKGPNRGELRWNEANHGAVYTLLQHPAYAGAYCYGRTHTEPRIPGQSQRRRTTSMKDWQVLKKDALPAYISWDQYVSNVETLSGNAFRSDTPGAPRSGSALLGSIVKCGRCQRRMSVVYNESKQSGRYVCHAAGPGTRCQSIQAHEVDRVIVQQMLRALEPASIELSLQAVEEIQSEHARLNEHWKRRREQAKYEVDRAQRQYRAVEPENRMVARELERMWESALRAQQEIDEECTRSLERRPSQLSNVDREEIESLASAVPALWNASTTTTEQRKAITRQLIDSVTLDIQDNSDHVSLHVTWSGGFESHHEYRRSVLSYEQMLDFDRLRHRLVELRGRDLTAKAIAEQLNQDGFRTARGKMFAAITVQTLLFRSDLTGDKEQLTDQQLPAAHRWSIPQLVSTLGVPTTTLCHWCRRGWAVCSKTKSKKWIIWADSDELIRLRKLAAFRRTAMRDYPAELTTPKPLPQDC